MQHLKHLETAFPEHWRAIQSARNAEPLFEEICSDFEQLSADLDSAASGPDKISSALSSDYENSLRALRQEILDWLEGRRMA